MSFHRKLLLKASSTCLWKDNNVFPKCFPGAEGPRAGFLSLSAEAEEAGSSDFGVYAQSQGNSRYGLTDSLLPKIPALPLHAPGAPYGSVLLRAEALARDLVLMFGLHALAA